MYTQFFGNYLLSKNYVTKEQLFRAMKNESKQNVQLGTLVISAGLMTASEVDNIIALQEQENRKFGELAIESGYLTNEDIMNLLKKPYPDFLLIAQSLLDDKIFNYSDFELMLADYRSGNEITDVDLLGDKDAIARIFENYFIMSETPITKLGKLFLELLFNNFIRFVGEDYTPLSCDECHEFPTEVCSKQEVVGEYSVASYLNMDEATAIEFASRYAGEEFDEYNEYVQASIEDFLNLHNGLFIVNCSNAFSMELEITAPENLPNTILEFSENTFYISVLYSFGMVHFIIEIKKTVQ